MFEFQQIGDVKSARAWLVQLRGVYFSRATPPVSFTFAHIGDEQNRALTHKANGLRNTCGCGQAGLAMTLAVLASAGRLATDDVPFAATPWTSWLLAALFVGLAASLAKTITLLVAHRRLIRLAEEISGIQRHRWGRTAVET